MTNANPLIVTVYTSGPSCGGCTATKAHFRRKGIPYTEVPLDDDNREAAIYLGHTTAPVVVAETPEGPQEWSGYRPDRIDALAAYL